MKKLMVIVMVVVMMLVNITASLAEEELYHGDLRDYVYFKNILDEFNNAVENGIEIQNDMYLYDGYIYMTDTYIDPSRVGYTGPIDGNHTFAIKNAMYDILKEEGAKHVQVELRLAGWDANGNDIYYASILMMENMNEYQGEKSGNGFIQEGLEYYGLITLARIWDY